MPRWKAPDWKTQRNAAILAAIRKGKAWIPAKSEIQNPALYKVRSGHLCDGRVVRKKRRNSFMRILDQIDDWDPERSDAID